MPNAVKGEVPLSLSDGRSLTLVLDMEALVEAESAYGKPLPRLMEDAAAGFVGAIRAMLYGALSAKHPGITLREASAMLASDGPAVSAALELAANAAMPKSNGSAEGQKRENPPGKPSGRNGVKSARTTTASGA